MTLGAKQVDGLTMREHLLMDVRLGGRRDARLDVQMPPALGALWNAYASMDHARPAGFGPCGIPPSEIVAWQQAHGARLTTWEIETLEAVDRARMKAQDALQQQAAQTSAALAGRA